jgi:T5SS/PEP-CTERM-associated repeat protein
MFRGTRLIVDLVVGIMPITILVLGPATVAHATKYWKNSVVNGTWNTGNNWSAVSAAGADNGGVPVGGEGVNIAHTDGTARTVTYDVNAPAIGVLSIDLTGAGAAANTLSIPNNNNLTVAVLDVGGYNGAAFTNGRGAVVQSAGTTTVSAGGDLILGVGTGSTGTYTLSGGALVANQSEFIGLNGTGTFNHSAGTNTINANAVGSFFVGYNAGAVGTYNLSGTGALVSNESQYIGYSSNDGYFNQTGGTNHIIGAGNHLHLGYNANSAGIYTISGGELSVGGDVIVGSSGTGSLWVNSGASVFVLNNVSINNFSVLNINGGTLRFNGISGLNRVNYFSGTVQLAGPRYFTDATITTLYGANPTIPSGKGLTVEHRGTIDTIVTVDGGDLNFTPAGDFLEVALGSADGTLVITNGGTVESQKAFIGDTNHTGVVSVSGAGSAWNIAGDLEVGYGAGVGHLTVNDEALVHIDVGDGGSQENGILKIQPTGTVTLAGGTIRFIGFELLPGGVFDFRAGTIQLAGNRSVGSDTAIADIFGGAPTLTAGKGLIVEGTATLQATVTLDGGTFTAPNVVNGQHLNLQRGTLNITNQAVTIGPGGLLGGVLDVNEDMTVNVTLGITNQGLVTGDGQIGGPFANAATGELRAQAGRSLRLTGSGNTNAGQIKLFGGELEFTQNLTNSAGAFISGNGSLIVGGGLVNQGTMNFAGTANIDGAVTNAVGGKIISGGGGATIFYDDVTNNGEIRTSTNGFAVFFGSVSGSGTFTGTGTVNVEGDLSPGNSPAALNFAGDVALGAESNLQIELGGTAVGTQFDQINVAGELALGGTLTIELINGFTPGAGQSFDILNAGTLAGAFSSIELPAIPGLAWNTSQLNSGILSVVPGLLGDYNEDGTVNAADYTVYRNRKAGIGGTTLPNDAGAAGVTIDDYNYWKAHYGESLGSGAGDSPTHSSTAPEPSTTALAAIGIVVFACGRVARRRVFNHGR